MIFLRSIPKNMLYADNGRHGLLEGRLDCFFFVVVVAFDCFEFDNLKDDDEVILVVAVAAVLDGLGCLTCFVNDNFETFETLDNFDEDASNFFDFVTFGFDELGCSCGLELLFLPLLLDVDVDGDLVLLLYGKQGADDASCNEEEEGWW